MRRLRYIEFIGWLLSSVAGKRALGFVEFFPTLISPLLSWLRLLIYFFRDCRACFCTELKAFWLGSSSSMFSLFDWGLASDFCFWRSLMLILVGSVLACSSELDLIPKSLSKF